MDSVMAMQAHYSEYQRQVAWVNENAWQFEQGKKRYRVRTMVAKALIILANALAPTKRDVQTA